MTTLPQHGITTLFFRNRHLLTLSILVILVAGVSAVINLPRLEDPRSVNRYPLIVTPVSGASATRVETLVTEVLEESLQEVSAIKDFESTSRSGVSVILLELEPTVDATTNQEVFSEIRDKIAEVKHRLPVDAQEPIIDEKREPAGFTQIIALRWNSDETLQMGILNRLAGDLSDRIRNVEGTDLVRLYGEPAEEITVTVNPEDLIELGLNVNGVSKRVAAGDSKSAAGTLRGSESNVLLEVEGELNSMERIAAIPLTSDSNQSVIRLGDIADIQRNWRRPADEISLVDGNRSVLVAARMDDSRRVDRWAGEVNAIIENFSEQTGHAVVVDPIFQQEHYTSRQLSELAKNLVFGALVVVAVVFFMMGWRLALIVGIALPLVVSIVLFGLQVSGNAIHQMSIYGIIIALGLLIDNAIVVADEVTRYKTNGYSSLEAVDHSVRHLFLPLLASTATTILAFAPILMLPGNVGDFVGSIGSSVIMALSASFFVALTIVASLAGLFAKPVEKASTKRFWRDGMGTQRITKGYRRILQNGFRVPVAAILLVCFLPASGFLAARSLGNEFFPPVDRDMFDVQVWLSSDSSIENTRRQIEAIDTEIQALTDTQRTFWLVGGSFPTVYYNLVMNKDNLSHYAHGIVTASSNGAAKRMIPKLQSFLNQRFPNSQIVVGQFGQGPPVVADVEYRLFGPDLSMLQQLGEKIRLVLQDHEAVLHTQATLPGGEPKLWLDADEDEARLAGLSLNNLANELQGNLEGIVGGSVVENLEQMPVRIRYSDAHRADLNHIASTSLVNPQGGDWIPLSALGELKLKPELGAITRFNTERTNIIKGFTRNGALPIEVTHQVLEQLEATGFALPKGYRLEFGGALEQDTEAMSGLFTYLPVLIVLTAATLILTFNSVKLALLLALVAGLSVGPGLLATWAINLPVSFNTLLGTLGLIGLAFNNSIVVLASIRANSLARCGDVNAVVDQVVATTRHILSTTLTTIGGFLPLLVIVGGDFWPSLAIVMAGGVGGSMILALIFVPPVYILINHSRRPLDTKLKAKVKPKPSVSTFSRVVGTVSLLFFLNGCAVGPDYVTPNTDLELHYGTNQSKTSMLPTIGPLPDSRWWQALKDPLLGKLIDQAVEHNYDLQIARAGVREARAMRQATKSQLYPKVGAGTSYRRQRASENGPVDLRTLSDAGLAKIETDLFELGFDAAWELDIFGGIRRSVESSDAELQVAIEIRRDTMLSVIAEVARNYVELRGAQRRLAVAQKNIQIQSETLTLVQNKYKTGLASQIDPARAAAQLQSTKASVPPFRAEIASAAHRLAVLTGKPPKALFSTLLKAEPLQESPDLVPAGIPSELLRRRPDVRRAERQLIATNAKIGQATADLYPRFFLTGLAGLESISVTDYFTGPSRAWSLGPTIRWPIFQGGKIRANISSAEARFDADYARFQQTVLLAAEDVENSLVRFAEQQNQREKFAAAEHESMRSVELAHVLYDKGLRDFLTVLDAERRLPQVRDRLVQSETSVVLAMIALYKALGGGWQVYDQTEPPSNNTSEAFGIF